MTDSDIEHPAALRLTMIEIGRALDRNIGRRVAIWDPPGAVSALGKITPQLIRPPANGARMQSFAEPCATCRSRSTENSTYLAITPLPAHRCNSFHTGNIVDTHSKIEIFAAIDTFRYFRYKSPRGGRWPSRRVRAFNRLKPAGDGQWIRKMLNFHRQTP